MQSIQGLKQSIQIRELKHFLLVILQDTFGNVELHGRLVIPVLQLIPEHVRDRSGLFDYRKRLIFRIHFIDSRIIICQNRTQGL